ncbi:MAG TPA: acyl-CoA dehydrogenase family protein [Acetobacteraceae bacterium]|nr:acyl-CoA dehydrogenase family protein [Acetobacteraceae bacterium]
MPDEALKAGTAGVGAPGIDKGGIANGAMDWLGRVRALAPRIAAAAAEIEHEQRLPERLVADLRAAGLFSLLIPRPFNGAEIDPPTFVAILEAIAAIDASTAWCLGQNNVCASVAAFLPAEAAREIFGGEPQAILAWGAGYGGKALAVEGGYRVSGKWSFTSGGHHATWLGAHCVVSEADGRERRGPDGKPVTRTMLFPATETCFQEIWHVIGLRGTGSDAYAIENLFVPEAHSLARDEPGERRYSGPLYLYSSNSLYASGFAGVALGIARAMLDALVALAKEKTSRGLSNPMRLSPVSQYEIAEAEARLRAARMYLMGTVSDVWQEVLRADAITLEQRIAIRLAATHVIREATKIADFAYSWAGATAIFETSPFERRFRDIHAVAQQLQGRASNLETAGQFLLGVEPDTTFV